jgi:raffinose/stachyose/melibiose transport system permease protein
MKKRKIKLSKIFIFILLSVVASLFVIPVLIVIMNSFKSNISIGQSVFAFPNSLSFVGFANYTKGFTFGAYSFWLAFFYSVYITISSVFLILLCASMAAWFILRVNNKFCKVIYYLCIFSMVVPFQMVMFTLSKTADTLYLNNPFTISIIYLGFGAGLAIFLFTGFMKSIPYEIEEAAAIDGCSPIQMFFKVILPICKPIYISVAILEIMWIWNDYLLPYLTLDRTRYRTIPIHVQYLQGSYGTVDMGATMAVIVMCLLPVIIIYILFQKHIIKGVVDGAVK